MSWFTFSVDNKLLVEVACALRYLRLEWNYK